MKKKWKLKRPISIFTKHKTSLAICKQPQRTETNQMWNDQNATSVSNCYFIFCLHPKAGEFIAGNSFLLILCISKRKKYTAFSRSVFFVVQLSLAGFSCSESSVSKTFEDSKRCWLLRNQHSWETKVVFAVSSFRKLPLLDLLWGTHFQQVFEVVQ